MYWSRTHTGVQSTVTFHPADENTGIKFIRNDKGDKVVTPDIDNVVDLTVVLQLKRME